MGQGTVKHGEKGGQVLVTGMGHRGPRRAQGAQARGGKGLVLTLAPVDRQYSAGFRST